jgi:hypothetical protein
MELSAVAGSKAESWIRLPRRSGRAERLSLDPAPETGCPPMRLPREAQQPSASVLGALVFAGESEGFAAMNGEAHAVKDPQPSFAMSVGKVEIGHLD